MKILAIETSFDETSAAIVERQENTVKLLSQSTATSMNLHIATGGVIPETAAREQIKYIIPVVHETLNQINPLQEKKGSPEIDAIAVTYGPGLIGSLLVGVETAKTLSYVWNKPLIPINHLFGHIYANFIDNNTITFPLIALIASGAHTDLLFMKSHTDIIWLGGTRDDAAGECFDKTGRLLGLSYPAGPEIEKRAQLGNSKIFHFPRPLLHDKAYDFSFSGLKTAVLREVEKRGSMTEDNKNDLCRGIQDAIIDVLVSKTLQAARTFSVKSILLSGGVAANQTLKETFTQKLKSEKSEIHLHVPQKMFCTDNAAMIGAAAFFQGQEKDWREVAANPELYFD